MRKFIAILTILTISFLSYGQKAMTFNEAEKQNIQISSLDRQYQSGIHADTSLAVFKTNINEYIEGYQKLLQDLGQYLKANNFLWDKPTKGFNRIYFAENGSIDYFLYSFSPNQMTIEQENLFGELLRKFIVNYQFPLEANTPFSQCGSVLYTP